MSVIKPSENINEVSMLTTPKKNIIYNQYVMLEADYLDIYAFPLTLHEESSFTRFCRQTYPQA